jgi:hypothetical protein
MAIRVSVQNRFQIIVPVRIDRAVRGAPQLTAPDVDDRAWLRNNAAGLNVTDARGILFGATVGDVVRFRVVREDLDSGPLFVTVTGNQVAIAQPAGGGPLPADGIFSVRAVADTTTGSKVQVRFGSATGPVICEACAHTFTLLTLNIAPHICTIHQAATAAAGTGVVPSVGGATLDDTVLTSIFDLARATWRPLGYDLNVRAALPETYTGFIRDDFASQQRPGAGTPVARSEENLVIRQNQVANHCNIYFLRFMDRSLGVGVRVENRANDNLTRSGCLIGVEGSSANAAGGGISTRSSAGTDLIQEIANDVAHEIGHFLTLPHASNVNNPGLNDTYGRRRLMHPVNLLPTAVTPATATSVPRFDDIGYGLGGSGAGVAGHRGCLLTLKDHPSDGSDGEVIAARRRFRSPNLMR